jgi:FAD/FMN-containing dehydrogenase
VAFDQDTGVLNCEAGVSLKDIQQTAVPKGWMLPITPGSQFVTVGGAIANDVHGKNHHVMGSFGHFVRKIKLLRTSGEVIDCSPQQNEQLFSATLGGIGLTGIILQAELQLRSVTGPWLNSETIAFENIDEFFALTEQSESEWEYTVSWIDCVAGAGGRGLFMRANHTDAERPAVKPTIAKNMPFVPPISLVNRLSLRPFNKLYYWLSKQTTQPSITHYQPFFYPLDNLENWNRMYGPKGFYQYQSVVPLQFGREATIQMLKAIAESGQGSFLAVLKTFSKKASLGMLGFPMEGVTLALDFPNQGQATLGLFNRLDVIVREAKGRIYLAKDARMPREMFAEGYPLLSNFLKFRDPGISSQMSRRLMGY